MTYKVVTTTHSISKNDIESFNKELAEFTEQKYIAMGGMAVASTFNPETKKVVTTYCISLYKSVSVEVEETKS